MCAAAFRSETGETTAKAARWDTGAFCTQIKKIQIFKINESVGIVRIIYNYIYIFKVNIQSLVSQMVFQDFKDDSFTL